MPFELLNESALEELAGERAFDRGVDYFEEGHVAGIKEQNGVITAGVRGTHEYRVRLWEAEDELAFDCNCPVGQDRIFCKHCVAVGLAWLDRCEQKDGEPLYPGRKRAITDKEIRAHLMREDKDALIELVLEQCERDSEFRDRLVLLAAEKSGDGPDLATFRAAIDKAVRHGRFVEYARMPAYTRGIETVIDSLDALLKRGHNKSVLELVEWALRQMEPAMNAVDDSDGLMGGILYRLQELHLASCRGAKLDPVALAKFLFEWEVSSDWEVFLGAAESYADVLGKAGLAEYRKLAEARWTKVPPLAPQEKDPEQYGSRWRITHMMETLAKQSGDIEALVAVKSRDLSQAFDFLEIAQIYKAAGDDDAAMRWAERGAQAFPEHTDSRLRQFLIEEYHSRNRHDESVAIAWAEFREQPGLDGYVILHRSASRAKQWPAWRAKAIELLHDEIAATKKRQSKSGWGSYASANHSEMVRIYLWEGDLDAAWAEAKHGGCHNDLWFRLAEAREKDHPEDALAVYGEQLNRALQHALPRAYQETVEILRKLYPLKMRVGKEFEFAALVGSIRATYKARRNLMKLLNVEGW
jgi:uncharacterized Zn finger protein